MKKFLRWLWYNKKFPILWRYPYGGLVLVWSDEMGIGLMRNYEEGIWKFLRQVVKPGWDCLDLGANQGFYTVLLSRLVGPAGHIVAFEPVESERRKLAINLALNGTRSKLRIESIALSDNSGFYPYYKGLRGHASRSGLAIPPDETGGDYDTFFVATASLDSYFGWPIERIDLIKIDVEGAELKVLKGAQRVLGKSRPIIIIEIADVATQQFDYPAQTLVDTLELMGYVLFEESGYKLEEKDYYRETCIAIPKEKVPEFSYTRVTLDALITPHL